MGKNSLVEFGSGDGYGYGPGFGYGPGDGDGYGSGSGYGSGYGDGDGYGPGSGYGSGFVYGSGHGFGDGYGDGYGNGDGYGSGDGSGNGYGNGSGHGYGEYIISIKSPIEAYHCIPRDGRIGHEHCGQRPKVRVGLVLEYHGKLRLCSEGLHASLKLQDARRYCNGIATRVACSGRVIFGEDKFVCSRREVIEIIG
jgi:hypothetical protein